MPAEKLQLDHNETTQNKEQQNEPKGFAGRWGVGWGGLKLQYHHKSPCISRAKPRPFNGKPNEKSKRKTSQIT